MNSKHESLVLAKNGTSTITPVQQMISSCGGAMLTSLFVTPLDVIKVRLQAQQKELMISHDTNQIDSKTKLKSSHDILSRKHFTDKHIKDLHKQRTPYFNGTMDAFIKISKSEGITSLWSGLPPTLAMVIPSTVIYFTMYDQLCTYLRNKYNPNNSKPGALIPLLAGGTARTIAATIISPIEMIRTKMQSKNLSYFEIGVAVKQLVKNEGFFSLWKGLSVTLFRDVPFSCLYWVNYESFKSYFKQQNPSFGFSFAAGAVSGSIASVVTLPFDVVKTHRQIELGEKETANRKANSKKTIDIMIQIYRQNGIKGLFTGLVPRIGRVAPACAIMISSYELGKSFFRNYNQSKLQS